MDIKAFQDQGQLPTQTISKKMREIVNFQLSERKGKKRCQLIRVCIGKGKGKCILLEANLSSYREGSKDG